MKTAFTTVRTEGGILPADLLTKIVQRNSTIGGVSEESYHVTGEKLNEAISRSWNRLLGVWRGFHEAAAKLPAGDFGTSITREKWLLPLFEELHYGRLKQRTFDLDGTTVPISHGWENVPIHLVGFGISIDKRTPGAAGAAKKSPHSLLQEYLNRSTGQLWGIVSNGETLRILRDNIALTRQAYVEFDLKAMMEGEVYSDFALLWMLCHQSRLDAAKPEEFWLERWSKVSQEQGVRALDQLRDGVAKAIEALGGGFLGHPDNQSLRDALASGELDKQEYYRQLLRIVYRLLFLFAAEDRDLLLDDEASAEARLRYTTYYSTQRLRQLTSSTRGTRHTDLYEQLRFVIDRLGADDGCRALALKPLGGFLFSNAATAALNGCRITNSDLLAAVRSLSILQEGRLKRVIDFRNLRSEELGSVYEALLELHPQVHLESGTFELTTAAGHERKTTGSYYTPESLVQLLLDSALDPVLAEAARKSNAEQAILALKVCDPACGSGHFLIAAAHRIAKKLAYARTGEEEPSPTASQHALREVIAHCIYGVDINPMALELCRVNLWMESIERGKPLSFLDHHLQLGNSLLGATPRLLHDGIPDDAFKRIEGDDPEVCRRAKKRNREYRETRQETFTESWDRLGDWTTERMRLETVPGDTLQDEREKEKLWQSIVDSTDYLHSSLWADAWCAAFVWRKLDNPRLPPPLTEETFRKIELNPYHAEVATRNEVQRLARQYQFFHWQLRFPEVFRVPLDGEHPDNPATGWIGGFDVVLGNPPWDRVKIQEKEWFAARIPEIAAAPNAAARGRMIEDLRTENATLYSEFIDTLRESDGWSHLLRDSARYPLGGRGDVNTYAVFAELDRSLLAPRGRAGFIVPSGIATDDTTKFLFQDLMESGSLVSLFDFQSGPGLFGEIGHARFKFCLLTLGGKSIHATASEFAFFLREVVTLADDDKRFTLSRDDIALLNPNTKTCPIFRSRKDAEITKAIYRRVPVLIKEGPPEENPWRVGFLRMFDMSNDSDLFGHCTRENLERDGWRLHGNRFVRDDEVCLPLYEAKMMHHFNHRFGDYSDHPEGSENTSLPDVPIGRLIDADYEPLPRYWIPAPEVKERLRGRWDKQWLLGWRDITNATNERAVVASVIPRVGVGHTMPLVIVENASEHSALLAGLLSSFALDYIARQKIGGTHLTYGFLKQIAVPPPQSCIDLQEFVTKRLLELSFTSHDLTSFARDCGYNGPPFRWDEMRRFLLRCELDAAFFHLYSIVHDDVDYIMDTFPIIRRDDVASHDHYRTKLTILDIYDRMQQAKDASVEYETILDPPPADSRVTHAATERDARIAIAAEIPRIEIAQGVEQSTKKRHGIFFERGAIAAYIINQLHGSPYFGRVQLEKLLYLAEAHVGVDLQGEYHREAAGPLDPDIYKLESLARKQQWFTAKKRTARTNAFYYVPGPAMSERVAAGGRILGDNQPEFDRLLHIFRKTDTEQAEIIATLYGGWNDLLLDGKTPADDDVIAEVRERWHEKKRRFDPQRLRVAIAWMREKSLVPHGSGPRTITQAEP
jgi:hypothetical protein